MRAIPMMRGASGLLVVLMLAGTVFAQTPRVPAYDRNAPLGDPPPVPGTNGAGTGEVQARGPLHEGFAQPIDPAPRPGPVAPKAPPEPIPEAPPEQRPEGANVVWIPGYWSWDDGRSDWLWVSGFWRVAPPGRKWVPGYWVKTDAGWQWVSGFWADANLARVPYVDPPPDSLERGPSIPPPDEGYYYVPGAWVYPDDRWLWRPGFWCPGRIGWVYTPPRYAWTPAGTLYVNGYWDYDLSRRGLLFAPVRFPGGFRYGAGFAYRPGFALNTTSVLSSLWIRPELAQYAFGDYYGAGFARAGYRPWITYGTRGRDPLFTYYRWANRRDPAWQTGMADLYLDRNRGNAVRPPRTLAEQERLFTSSRTVPANLRVVQPLSTVRGDPVRLANVTPRERTANERFATAAGRASIERRTIETSTVTPGSRTASLPLARFPAPPSIRASDEPLEGTAGRLGITPRSGTGRASFYPPTNRAATPSTPTTTPRLTTPPAATPRRTTTPPPTILTPSSGRAISGTPSSPRTTTPAPRTSTPMAPRVNVPAVPRVSVPAVPRASVPAPRVSTPAPRVSTPAPRPASPGRR